MEIQTLGEKRMRKFHQSDNLPGNSRLTRFDFKLRFGRISFHVCKPGGATFLVGVEMTIQALTNPLFF